MYKAVDCFNTGGHTTELLGYMGELTHALGTDFTTLFPHLMTDSSDAVMSALKSYCCKYFVFVNFKTFSDILSIAEVTLRLNNVTTLYRKVMDCDH